MNQCRICGISLHNQREDHEILCETTRVQQGVCCAPTWSYMNIRTLLADAPEDLRPRHDDAAADVTEVSFPVW